MLIGINRSGSKFSRYAFNAGNESYEDDYDRDLLPAEAPHDTPKGRDLLAAHLGLGSEDNEGPLALLATELNEDDVQKYKAAVKKGTRAAQGRKAPKTAATTTRAKKSVAQIPAQTPRPTDTWQRTKPVAVKQATKSRKKTSEDDRETMNLDDLDDHNDAKLAEATIMKRAKKKLGAFMFSEPPSAISEPAAAAGQDEEDEDKFLLHYAQGEPEIPIEAEGSDFWLSDALADGDVPDFPDAPDQKQLSMTDDDRLFDEYIAIPDADSNQTKQYEPAKDAKHPHAGLALLADRQEDLVAVAKSDDYDYDADADILDQLADELSLYENDQSSNDCARAQCSAPSAEQTQQTPLSEDDDLDEDIPMDDFEFDDLDLDVIMRPRLNQDNTALSRRSNDFTSAAPGLSEQVQDIKVPESTSISEQLHLTPPLSSPDVIILDSDIAESPDLAAKDITLQEGVTMGFVSPVKPIVRRPFPQATRDRSPITGLSACTVLRTCFRIGEALREGCQAARENKNVVLELYARVSSAAVDMETGKLSYTFVDLFHDRPPKLNAVYTGWKGAEPWQYDSTLFLRTIGDESWPPCRCLGQIRRNMETKEWELAILNIWQADWDDVNYVRGILAE